MFLHLFGHANAVVRNDHIYKRVFCSHFYRYKTAGWSKLNSIGDQIGSDLKDQVFVSIERYFRKISGQYQYFWQTRWALGKGLPDEFVHLKRRFSFQR